MATQRSAWAAGRYQMSSAYSGNMTSDGGKSGCLIQGNNWSNEKGLEGKPGRFDHIRPFLKGAICQEFFWIIHYATELKVRPYRSHHIETLWLHPDVIHSWCAFFPVFCSIKSTFKLWNVGKLLVPSETLWNLKPINTASITSKTKCVGQEPTENIDFWLMPSIKLFRFPFIWLQIVSTLMMLVNTQARGRCNSVFTLLFFKTH